MSRTPGRYEIRDQLADAIARDVKAHLPEGITCWVWLCLQDAGFAKA